MLDIFSLVEKKSYFQQLPINTVNGALDPMRQHTHNTAVRHSVLWLLSKLLYTGLHSLKGKQHYKYLTHIYTLF